MLLLYNSCSLLRSNNYYVCILATGVHEIQEKNEQ